MENVRMLDLGFLLVIVFQAGVIYTDVRTLKADVRKIKEKLFNGK